MPVLNVQNYNANSLNTHSAIVTLAGTNDVNGTYAFDGLAGSRPSYAHSIHDVDYLISWDGAQWGIADVTNDETMYSSEEDVAYPWLVEAWIRNTGVNPVPTVTEGS